MTGVASGDADIPVSDQKQAILDSNNQSPPDPIELGMFLAGEVETRKGGNSSSTGLNQWSKQNGLSETNARRYRHAGLVLNGWLGSPDRRTSEEGSPAIPEELIADEESGRPSSANHLSHVRRLPEACWAPCCYCFSKFTLSNSIKSGWRQPIGLPLYSTRATSMNRHRCFPSFKTSTT